MKRLNVSLLVLAVCTAAGLCEPSTAATVATGPFNAAVHLSPMCEINVSPTVAGSQLNGLTMAYPEAQAAPPALPPPFDTPCAIVSRLP